MSDNVQMTTMNFDSVRPEAENPVKIMDLSLRDGHQSLFATRGRTEDMIPVAELMDLASRCVDAKTGRCKVPGFYDDVVRPTRRELESFKASGFKPEVFRKAHELKSLRSKDPMDLMQRIWARPTFEIHGMAGGYSGPGVKTVVPQKAELKVSMRLVPGQRPAKILRLLKNHVKKLNPDVKVVNDSVLEPYMGKFSGPYADAARTAVRYGFGKETSFIREGGSIGAVVTMQKLLKAPISFLGLEDTGSLQ